MALPVAREKPAPALAEHSEPSPPIGDRDDAGWRIVGATSARHAEAGPQNAPTRQVSVAFDQAPLATVVDAIVGGILQRAFRIDPDLAAANLTLRVSGRRTEAELLTLLGQALRPINATLVPEAGGSLAIVPSAKAPALTAPPSMGQPAAEFGPGVVIYTATQVSASELVRLLSPLAGTSAQLRADPAREQIYISGDAVTVNALLRTARMFDVDWLRGLSFQFVPLKHSPPSEIIAQVRHVFGGADGPIGSALDFVELARLNAVLIVAKRPDLLDQTTAWIERLDQPSARPTRRFRVVPLTNLVAKDFVQTLTQLIGQQTSQAAAGTGGENASGVANQTAGAPAAASAAPQGQQANRLRITADPASNSIVLYADDAEYQDVIAIVKELDIAPPQVLVEATVAEITLNDQLRFGVQWFIEQSGDFTGGFSTSATDFLPSQFPGFSIRAVGKDYRAVLNSLSAVTDVQLVSTPRILVLSNQTARLQVGDQVPVIIQSAVSTIGGAAPILNSVQYRDTGVVLSVTPRVGDQGRMFIEIEQEVSEVAGTTSSNIDSPTIQQRKFSTQIQVEDGQVVALGGLIRSNRTVGDTGMPLLGRAPVIGALFNSRDRSSRQTELVVFLRPTIVRSRADSDRLTDEIMARMQALGLDREPAK
jgi:general secretion pathway protein D